MSKVKIKIITGFRGDQYYTIDAEEAHKAYYLFLNPEKRGVFQNGVALIGKHIQGIQPDWHAMMGYNPTYTFEYTDWNEITKLGLREEADAALEIAKKVAEIAESKPDILENNLSLVAKQLDLIKLAPVSQEVKQLSEKMNINKHDSTN